MLESRAQQARRDIHYGDDAGVIHARRANNAEHPDHLAVDLVGRAHQAAAPQQLVAGLLADEDLDPLGRKTAIEQVQDLALLGEGLEQSV